VPRFAALHDSDYALVDFRPTAGSSLIDKGRFLMRANGAGTNATTVTVKSNGGSADPRNYFIAPNSYLGPLASDTKVQIEGCGVRNIVTMTATSITFTPSCSWTDNAGVHLPWAGPAPDIGAYEIGLTGGPASPVLISVEPAS
jgi:hypothetical protein